MEFQNAFLDAAPLGFCIESIHETRMSPLNITSVFLVCHWTVTLAF